MKTSDRTSESGFVCTTSSLQTEVLMFIYKIAVEEGKKTNGLIEGCLQWIQLWMAVLHTQHCHYYNFFKSYKKKRKNENYARVHKKSPGCFSTHTHTQWRQTQSRGFLAHLFSVRPCRRPPGRYFVIWQNWMSQCWITRTLLVSSWPPVASQTCKIFTLFACKYMYIIVLFFCLFVFLWGF